MNPLGADKGGFPYLCADCVTEMPWQNLADHCPVCGEPKEQGALKCDFCLDGKKEGFQLDGVWSACRYSPPVSGWIHHMKYERQDGLSRVAARLWTLAPLALEKDGPHTADLVVPVPLHISRLRWRGFNQSLLLAHQWVKRLRMEGRPAPLLVGDMLARSRKTRPQMEIGMEERKHNVAMAFEPGRGAVGGLCEGKRVILVDDVMTTGATLNQAAGALKQAGAARVEALVLARA